MAFPFSKAHRPSTDKPMGFNGIRTKDRARVERYHPTLSALPHTLVAVLQLGRAQCNVHTLHFCDTPMSYAHATCTYQTCSFYSCWKIQ